MILDFNENKPVAVVLGAGAMAMAIIRRVAAGAKVLLGDVSEENLERAAEAMRFNGYDVETMQVNALDKDQVYAFAAKAAELGDVMWFVDTAGASPSQATPQFIIDLDLIGTSYAIDAFGPVMARGGAGLVVSSQAGWMGHFTEDEENTLATTPHRRAARAAHAAARRGDWLGQGLHRCQARQPPARARRGGNHLG